MSKREQAWEDLEFEMKRIVPDPKFAKNCHRCGGARGFHGVTVDTKVEGAGRYLLHICCGTTKTSQLDLIQQLFDTGFARILAKLETMELLTTKVSKLQNVQNELWGKSTLIGIVTRWWRSVWPKRP